MPVGPGHHSDLALRPGGLTSPSHGVERRGGVIALVWAWGPGSHVVFGGFDI